jgi:hypothetical protein
MTSISRSKLNDFWRQIVELACVEFGEEKEWRSLASLTKQIDLVVVGRPVSVEWQPDSYAAILDVQVDEVLKGVPVYASPGVIQFYAEDAFNPISGPMPGLPTVLFLRNIGDRYREYDQPVGRGDDYLYYTPTVYQNIFLKFRDRVFIPLSPRIRRWLGPDTWPLAVKGMPFDAFVDQIRRAAGEQLTSSGEGGGGGIRYAC